MKMGMRKPSVKKSIKARTTGKIKRSVKRSVNPLYGKNGVGFIKDPERSVKNAIYHRTTFGVRDIVENADIPNSNANRNVNTVPAPEVHSSGNGIFIFIIVLCSILALLGLLLTVAEPAAGIISIILGALGIVYGVRKIKANNMIN